MPAAVPPLSLAPAPCNSCWWCVQVSGAHHHIHQPASSIWQLLLRVTLRRGSPSRTPAVYLSCPCSILRQATGLGFDQELGFSWRQRHRSRPSHFCDLLRAVCGPNSVTFSHPPSSGWPLGCPVQQSLIFWSGQLQAADGRCITVLWLVVNCSVPFLQYCVRNQDPACCLFGVIRWSKLRRAPCMECCELQCSAQML